VPAEDNPPYMHDERLLTLEDTVEFFNQMLSTKLTPQEKQELVAFPARPLAGIEFVRRNAEASVVSKVGQRIQIE
jgi:cytochrome c peroxidase